MSERVHPTHVRTVRWDEIHRYARRFPEYKIVQAIAPDAQRIDVPLGRVGRRSPGTPVAAFGDLRPGDTLAQGWRVDVLRLDGVVVRVECSRGASTVIFAAVVSSDARPPGPFDAAPLRLWYERTEAAFSSFCDAGRDLQGRLLASLAGGDEARWRSLATADAARAMMAPAVHTRGDADALQVRADKKIYLRISDACQERCLFCFFYDTHDIDNLHRHHDLSEVIGGIDLAEIQQVVLTGGEPTLNPRLPEYIAMLAEKGCSQVILQTNGIRLNEPGYLEALLPYREVLGIGFSIHAASEATNDALTTVARGFFADKLRAVERCLDLGFRIKISLTLSRLNLGELVDFVELAAKLARGKLVPIQLTFPSFQGRQGRFLETYPRLEELAVAVPPALRRARELDLLVAFCHLCQIPPCVLPDDLQHMESLWFDAESSMWSEQERAYGPRCGECALRPRCSGIWKDYAAHFGTDALTPYRADEVPPPLEHRGG